MDEVVLKCQEKSQLSTKTYRFIGKSIPQKAQIKTRDSHAVFYDVYLKQSGKITVQKYHRYYSKWKRISTMTKYLQYIYKIH